MSGACDHPGFEHGRCTACGQACTHELILNGACYYCGSTELDGVALSPRPPDTVIPAERLTRLRRPSE